MNMKKILFTLFFVGMAVIGQAQYKVAVGIRLLDGPQVTGKFALGGNKAAEALVGGFGNGLKGTLLYEIHQSAFNSNQWRWYYGAGAHMGASPVRRKNYDAPAAVFHMGVDGIIGLEHTFNEIPLNFGIDWKPELNFVNYSGVYLPNFGLSFRLAF